MSNLTKLFVFLGVVLIGAAFSVYFWDDSKTLAIVVPVIIIGVFLLFTKSNKSAPSQNLKDFSHYWKTKMKRKDRNKHEPERVGVYFNVFQWEIIVRPVVCLTAAFIVSGIITTLVHWLLGFELINNLIFISIVLGFTIIFAQNEDEDEVVPEAHGAMVTLWGMRFDVFRKEGRYSWTGKRLGFNRSQTTHTAGTTSSGFIKLQPFPFQVWDSADSEVKKKLLTSHTSDSSEISTTLTLTIKILNPRLWLDSADPAMDLAEQARTSFRTAISFFTGIDCTVMKSVLVNLMQSKSILAAYVGKNDDVGGYPKGSIVRSRSGTPLYKIIDKSIIDNIKHKVQSDGEEAGKTQEEIDTAIKEVIKTLKEGFLQDEMPDEDTRGLHVELRTVEGVFIDALERLGVQLVKAAVGDVNLSEEVTKQANAAAGETFQLAAQIASAQAVAAAANIITEGTRGSSELEMALAAAQDNKRVQVVVTGGGGRNHLKEAAVAHAALNSRDNGE